MNKIDSIEEFEIFDKLIEPYKYFEKVEIIGKGSYGIVYRGIHRRTGQDVAIKVMPAQKPEVPSSIREVLALKKFSNQENICKFYGAFVIHTDKIRKKSAIWLVMEYCPLGNAKNLIDNYREIKNSKIPEKYCIYIFKGIVEGLKYLHAENIIHRDIKSPNIMFNPQGVVKIGDFGTCTKWPIDSENVPLFIGTTYWMAPEVILCKKDCTLTYDSKCDIWSFGVTCIELSEGVPPYIDISLPSVVLEIIGFGNKYKYKINIMRSFDFHNFIKECVVKDSSRRQTAEMLSRHPLLEHFTRKEKKIQMKFVMKLQTFINYRKSKGI